MPPLNIQTDLELFFIGSDVMQLMDNDGNLLATAQKASGTWSVTVHRDTTLNSTHTNRSDAASAIFTNAPTPKGDGSGYSIWHPNLSQYTD